MTKQEKDRKIQEFIARCRAARLKVTPQRLVIYQALLQDDSHPSPEKLSRKVRRSHPTIALATVYSTLEAFERHGLVARLTPLHDTVRFDPLVEQHHHVVCVRCKKVVNLPASAFDRLAIPAPVRRDNTVLGYSVHVTVVCAACRRNAAR